MSETTREMYLELLRLANKRYDEIRQHPIESESVKSLAWAVARILVKNGLQSFKETP